MTFLNAIPALAKTAVIFAYIILAIRKKMSLANAFATGSLFLALLFTLPPIDTIQSILAGVFDPKTLALCTIIALILVLSSSLEECGQLRRLLDNFQGLVTPPRLNLSIFPALIGLLPMPGGAVFSAPMVKELGERFRLSPAQLSYINYWFRHIWEYWWPMYPGVLLATLLADINLVLFIGVMIPFTVVVVWLGWLPVRKTRLVTANTGDGKGRKRVSPFIREITPIMVVIVLGLGLGWIISVAVPSLTVAKETGLVISLCVGIAMVWKMNHIPADRMIKLATNRHMVNMVYMVAAILVFKQVLEDSGAVAEICDELLYLNIPFYLICGVLPFIVGILTGITIAFVGSAFPILLSLIDAHGNTGLMIPYMMLGLSCGFAGVLISPVHLCLLLSNEYFGTNLRAVYRFLWLPCLCIVLCAYIYFFLLRMVMAS
ncbi:MAG: DUF401 family protein [Thermodesulfobacteriota bacterium]|nr:DUF401 family protein [Thermodesulfobacteriota bacterium]